MEILAIVFEILAVLSMDGGLSLQCEDSSKRTDEVICYLSFTYFKNLCRDLNVYFKRIEYSLL